MPKTCIKTGFRHFNPLFKLGVSFATLNYICLSFMRIHAAFYFNYINYSGLLIFCCQNVATMFLRGTTFLSELLFELFLFSYHYEYPAHPYSGLFRLVNHVFFKCSHGTITSCFSHNFSSNITITLYSFFL